MEETEHRVCLGQAAEIYGLNGLGSEVFAYFYGTLVHEAALHLFGIVLLHSLLQTGLIFLTFILIFLDDFDEIICLRGNSLFEFAHIES